MLSRVRDLALRNRRKFIITGVVIGGTILAIKYAKWKMTEIYERQTRDCYAKLLRQQHFQTTVRTCNDYIISMSYDMLNVIINECNTEELLEQLRKQPANKLQLWEELKIVTFTRLAAFVYASSILVVAARIQMNLLGGYLFRDKISGHRPAEISDQLKQQYLALNRYFIENGGLSDLIRFIRNKVICIFGGIQLDKLLNLTDMERLFWNLQLMINGDSSQDPCSNIAKYILPKQLASLNAKAAADCTNQDPLLQTMFNETLDFLESDDVCSVCSTNVWSGFSIAIDAMAEEMAPSAKIKQIKQTNTTIMTNGKSLKRCEIPPNDTVEDRFTSSSASSPVTALEVPTTSTPTPTPTATPIATATTTSTETSSLTESLDNTSSQSNISNGYIFKINDMSLALAKMIPIITKLTDECYDKTLQKQNYATSLISSYILSDKCNILGANVYEVFATNKC